MLAYRTTLRVFSLLIFAVALIHILLGVGAEPLLGSAISASSLEDPNLDSQNRFYGAAFMLFGVVWWYSSSDLARYLSILKASYVVFFVAGVVRVGSIWMVGWPAVPILGLMLIELILPWVMFWWLLRIVDPGR